MNVEEILDYTSFTIDREPHIIVDQTVCAACTHHACTTACPAGCYSWSQSDERLSFVYDACLECGTCYIVCDNKAFIRWRYPRGGFGVSYRMT